ncbi:MULTISPECIES: metallophosphoesterase [unclassified Haladaptatus]|uniref:metallophosphoesterase n=1 Tax=unclassified Haladaptatus TaxID=2622732 RepID=UPI0023E816B2|nr:MULTISPECIES: metallophosphoesterase [unclassified Haladaptatus]
MITVVSDTHGDAGHCLSGRTLDAVAEADLVLHAGDFYTAAALDAFEEEATRLEGVYGNSDVSAVRERLPAERVVEFDGLRIALTHGHRHTDTSLTMFGRQSNADLVVFGHSHQPGYEVRGDIGFLNPGSHADPRWYRPAHAELEVFDDHVEGRLIEPTGAAFDTFSIER